jgi:NADH-quinone oxidoreductase subunit L
MRPGQLLTKGLVEIDNDAVDGAGNELAALVRRASDGFRQVQTGFARSYALSMLTGAALVVAAIMAVELW